MIYNCLLRDQYAQFKSHTLGLILLLGGVYLGEKTYSKIKFVKYHNRSGLTDEHLQFVLIIWNNFES